MKRRDFVYALAGASGAAIVGYFATHAVGPVEVPTGIRGGARPALRSGVVPRRQGAQTFYDAPDGTLCAVNDVGERVIGLLDGRHTVGAVAGQLARDLDVQRTEGLEARVAEFVAQLGILGFLRQPFVAHIVYRSETTA